MTIFSKVHVHYRHELVFFWKFSRPRGGAHYATLNTVYLFLKITDDVITNIVYLADLIIMTEC